MTKQLTPAPLRPKFQVSFLCKPSTLTAASWPPAQTRTGFGRQSLAVRLHLEQIRSSVWASAVHPYSVTWLPKLAALQKRKESVKNSYLPSPPSNIVTQYVRDWPRNLYFNNCPLHYQVIAVQLGPSGSPRPGDLGGSLQPCPSRHLLLKFPVPPIPGGITTHSPLSLQRSPSRGRNVQPEALGACAGRGGV